MQNNTFWVQPLSNEGNILPDLAKKQARLKVQISWSKVNLLDKIKLIL